MLFMTVGYQSVSSYEENQQKVRVYAVPIFAAESCLSNVLFD
jgi:hypothetical protein